MDKLWIMSILLVLSVEESSHENYMVQQTNKLRLHQGAFLQKKGEIMLGKHELNVFIPIEIETYDYVLKEYLNFLTSGPTTLHTQLIAVSILETGEGNQNDSRNNVEAINDFFKAAEKWPQEEVLKLVKNLVPPDTSSAISFIEILRRSLLAQKYDQFYKVWSALKKDGRKYWNTVIKCLGDKEKFIQENWNLIEDESHVTSKSGEEGKRITIPRCFGSTKNMSVVISMETTLEEIVIALLGKVKHIESKLANVEKIYGNPNVARNKRGLFDFIGYAQKYLFGVSTTKDLEKVQSMVSHMKRGNMKILHVMGSMNAIMQRQVQKTEFLLEQTRTIEKQISGLAGDVMKVMNGVGILEENIRKEQILQTYSILLQQTTLGLEVLEDEVLSYSADLDQLRSGTITNSIITPEEFRQSLEEICKSLPEGKSCTRKDSALTYLNLYQDIVTNIVTLPGGLKCIKLQVPVNDATSTVKLYQVTKLPIPIKLKGDQCIQPVIKDNTLFGMRDKFGVEIDADRLKRCRKTSNTPPQCEGTTYNIMKKEAFRCVKGIITGENWCETEIVNIKEPSLFIQVDLGMAIFHFKKQDFVTLTCDTESGKKESQIMLEGYGQVIYDSDCDLQAGDKLYVGQHNLNSTERFVVKNRRLERMNLDNDQLARLKIWSQITTKTLFPSTRDLEEIQKVAEKTISKLGKGQKEFKSITNMIKEVGKLLNSKDLESQSDEWTNSEDSLFHDLDFGDWCSVGIIATLIMVIIYKCYQQIQKRRSKEVNNVVAIFRKNLEDRLAERRNLNEQNPEIPA